MSRSNGLFLEVIEVPPLQETGWEVRVVSYEEMRVDVSTRLRDPRAVTSVVYLPAYKQLLTVLSTFIEIVISPEISGVGAGSITLDMDAEFWNRQLMDGSDALTLLDHDHLWQVYEGGTLRFEFLGTTVDEVFLEKSETRGIVVSGPGIAQTLCWGKVMTPNFPNAPVDINTPGQYQFIETPVMSAWLTLLRDSQARGSIKFVNPTFTPTHDSAGELWEDTPAPPPPLEQQTGVLAADVLFVPDGRTLSKPGALAAVNDIVKRIPTTIATPQLTITGHADSTNTRPYNQKLSEDRARAVATEIRKQLMGRTPAQVPVMQVYGRGEDQPIASNNTAAGRQKNRRVTVNYQTQDPDLDKPYIEPAIGSCLLDQLKEWSGEDPNKPSPIRVEWFMHPGFNLDVRRKFGVHREREVVFYEGSTNTNTKSRQRVRDKIANFVAARNEFGVYSVASSRESIANWLQREEFKQLDTGEFDASSRNQIASTYLALTDEEASTWSITIPPYSPGRKIFQDFTLGDWIGVSRFLGGQFNKVEAFRVLAISVRVDSSGSVDLAELRLQSKPESIAKELQEQITSILNHQKRGTDVYLTIDEPISAAPGDIWIDPKKKL